MNSFTRSSISPGAIRLGGGRGRSAVILGLILVAGGGMTLSACSSSTPAAGTSASPSGLDTAAATTQVTKDWEAFFSKSTPLAQKAQYLQNGSAMSSTIQQFASNPLVGQVTAKVDSVKFSSPTQATVTYDIDGPTGTALLSKTTGTAYLQNGTWVVGDASLCSLLALTGTTPTGCSS
ncbi:MAG TPA: hypothetical protein VGM10_25140 [Actinocrinis sp.]|jgi:hypothetical protein